MNESTEQSRYAQDGVNVPVGDAFSAMAAQLIATTHGNCPYIEVEDLSQGLFRGPKPCSYVGLPYERICFEFAPDGVGTKVLLHDAMATHRNAAWDLLAMASTDITRFGGFPAVFSNVLAIRSFGGSVDSPQYALYKSMVEGLVSAANEIGTVLYKGETAEVGVCVGTDNDQAQAPFNWEGIAHGIFLRDKIIMGQKVRPGDLVVALGEDGFRSNGISAVRGAFARHYGPGYYNNPEAREDLLAACHPSRLYDRLLNTAHGWHEPDFQHLLELRLVAHISGGGIDKFGELLKPCGLSARLDNLFDLPPIMRKCAEWRGMSDEEVYTTWNGGQGVLVIVPVDDAAALVDMASQYGISAQVCGEITRSQETSVAVESKYTGGKLLFVPPQR